jgi:hypothetical protein
LGWFSGQGPTGVGDVAPAQVTKIVAPVGVVLKAGIGFSLTKKLCVFERNWTEPPA